MLSIHPSIPFPCYYFFLALSLIILLFFLSLVSSLLSFCLHVWFFLSVPLILCSSFSPFYSSSFVFHWWVHLLQVDFFIIYVPLAVDEFALSSSLATQTFPSGLLPGAEFFHQRMRAAVDNNTRFLLDVESQGGVKDKQGEQNSDRLQIIFSSL